MTDEEFSQLISKTKFPRTVEGKNATEPLVGVGSLSNYEQTPREQLVDFLSRKLYSDDREGRDRAEFLMRALDVTPAGIPLAASDTTRAISEGRYRDAVLPGIATALPFMGKPARMLTGMKRLGTADDVAETLANSQKAPNTLSPIDSGVDAAPPELPSPPQQTLPERKAHKVAAGRFENKLETDRELSNSAGFNVPKPAIPGHTMFWQRSSPWIAPRGPMGRPPRPFSADYPKGAATDDEGNLLFDMEGRPLTAPLIAGRRKLNGRDERVRPSDIRSLVENGMGAEIRRVPRDRLVQPWALGDAWYHIENGPELIQVWDALPEDQAAVVL
jgi:hypothetical protein